MDMFAPLSTFPTTVILFFLAAAIMAYVTASHIPQNTAPERLVIWIGDGSAILAVILSVAMILDGFGIGGGFLAATTPVCTLANRPRLTRAEYRAELAVSRIRRAAVLARAERIQRNAELAQLTTEPEIVELASGRHGVIIPATGDLQAGFKDYASADIFRIRWLERARKMRDLYPRSLA